MGASYSEMLRGGRMPDWEAKLRQATERIIAVREDVLQGIGDDGQYDNAGDEGGLAERLWIAAELIEDALPPTP